MKTTNTTAIISILLAAEIHLPGGHRFKITRATDGALHISVHASGDTRALYKTRIPVRDLKQGDITPIIISLENDLAQRSLLTHSIYSELI